MIRCLAARWACGEVVRFGDLERGVAAGAALARG